MNHIAIIEDELETAHQYHDLLESYLHQRQRCAVIDLYPQGKTFLESFRKQYDLLLMDIQMDEMDGIETARYVRKQDPEVCLIFITSMEQFAIQGYQVEAFRYLLKPLNPEELFSALDKAYARIDKAAPQRILIRTLEGETQLEVNQIEYAEIRQRQLWIHCGIQLYRCNMTLNRFEELLNNPDFFRCHEGYLIHMKHVHRFGKQEVIMNSEAVIPVSRMKKNDFLATFARYVGARQDV